MDYDFTDNENQSIMYSITDGIESPASRKKYASLVENVFVNIIEKANIEVKDVINLILGKPPLDKPFLRSLINGQLDVDKFDYLLRDSHYAGVKYGIYDLDSLLVKDNELMILENGFYTIEQLILARYYTFEPSLLSSYQERLENMAKKIARTLLEKDELRYPTLDQLPQ